MDVLAALPSQLGDRAEANVIKVMGQSGNCFDPAVSRYAAALDPKKRRKSEDLFNYLIKEGYSGEEASELLRANDPVRYPSQWAIWRAASSCFGEAGATSVMSDAVDREWMRLWKYKITPSNAQYLLSATSKTAVWVFSTFDVMYLAIRTAMMAIGDIDRPPPFREWLTYMTQENGNDFMKSALLFSRGRFDEEKRSGWSKERLVGEARRIDMQVRQALAEMSEREYEFDERMREVAEEAPNGEMIVDLEYLGVAALPFIDMTGRYELTRMLGGPVMIDEYDLETWTLMLAMLCASNIILWGSQAGGRTWDEAPDAALSAATAAVILARGEIRSRRSRRQIYNPYRFYDPSKPATDILKLWRRIFPNPSLAYIL